MDYSEIEEINQKILELNKLITELPRDLFVFTQDLNKQQLEYIQIDDLTLSTLRDIKENLSNLGYLIPASTPLVIQEDYLFFLQKGYNNAKNGELSEDFKNSFSDLSKSIHNDFSKIIECYTDLKVAIYNLLQKIERQSEPPKTQITPYKYDMPLNDYVSKTYGKDLFSYFSAGNAKTNEEQYSFDKNIETSVTEQYIPDSWDDTRILIDLVQNHLPSDSNGTVTIIRFRVFGSEIWHDLSEIKQYEDNPGAISEIQIIDDGKGYDIENLKYFFSDKPEESAGKFGEGLKMACGAAMKKGYGIELKSKNFKAIARFQKVNNKQTNALTFDIFSDKNTSHVGSSTTISFPNEQVGQNMVLQLMNIEHAILHFRKQKPLVKELDFEILDSDSSDDKLCGKTYVKGLLIPNCRKSILSYNFKNYKITTRDRDKIPDDQIEYEVGKCITQLQDKEIIKRILSYASQNVLSIKRQPYELTAPFEEFYDPDGWVNSMVDESILAWIEAYKELFGEECAIISTADNISAEYMANHVGLKTVKMPAGIAEFLKKLTGPNEEKIKSYDSEVNAATSNVIIIPENQLTEDEKTIITFLLNEVATRLPKVDYDRLVQQIKVYEYPDDYFGSKCDGFVNIGNDDTVYLNRAIFSNTYRLMDVFFHEETHAYTKVGDVDKNFRDFLTKFIGTYVIKDIFGKKIVDELKSLRGADDYYTLSETDSTISECQLFAKKIRELGETKKVDELTTLLRELKQTYGIQKLREAINTLDDDIGEG